MSSWMSFWRRKVKAALVHLLQDQCSTDRRSEIEKGMSRDGKGMSSANSFPSVFLDTPACHSGFPALQCVMVLEWPGNLLQKSTLLIGSVARGSQAIFLFAIFVLGSHCVNRRTPSYETLRDFDTARYLRCGCTILYQQDPLWKSRSEGHPIFLAYSS